MFSGTNYIRSRCCTVVPTRSFKDSLKFMVKKEIYFLAVSVLQVRRNIKLARTTFKSCFSNILLRLPLGRVIINGKRNDLVLKQTNKCDLFYGD